MSSSSRLSLHHAVLTNVNIMIGSGIFVNTVLLARSAGILGSAAYALVGIAIVPIMYAISGMLQRCPEGSFYDFSARLHPLIGFLTQWGYFFGKLGSGALSLHLCMVVVQGMFPALVAIPTLVLDGLMLALFMVAATRNLRVGGAVQGVFLVLKAIPILFMIAVCLGIYRGSIPSATWDQVIGMVECVPFIVFAFAGFEAVTALSKHIERPAVNGPRAIALSWIIVMTTVVAYQSSIYLLFGSQLGKLVRFYDVFPRLAYELASGPYAAVISSILLMGIAASSLGSSYGVIFSNAWNIQRLAEKKLFLGSSFLAPLSIHGAAARCVAFEIVIVSCYILLSAGSFVVLQQLSALGTTLAYVSVCLAFAREVYRRGTRLQRWGAVGAVTSSFGLLATAVINAAAFGYAPYIAYGLLLFAGFILYQNGPKRRQVGMPLQFPEA